jgi:hypothetical protein
MTKIFISYRRDDSDGHTGRLYDHLKSHFKEEDLFIDFHTITPGQAFPLRIKEALLNCDVLLAVIGRRWLTVSDSYGQRRLDDPNDFVRLEIATALDRGIKLIPVLVGGARMPTSEMLPTKIAKFAFIQGMELGNSTFGTDVKVLIQQIKTLSGNQISIPYLEWCSIPTGKLKLENQTFTVPPYKLSKFPVTYSQYELFVEAGGYKNQAYWTKLGWEWKKDKSNPQRYWKLRSWHISHHPVIGVTWYEAIAFCNWLSQLGAITIRLPTEWEWQFAAQGVKDRLYPWGNNFEKAKCNSAESELGGTTPVDKYEPGVSPFGLYDMAGNVLEWCLNDYEDITTIDTEKFTYKVLRGGSWKQSSALATTRFRQKQYPDAHSFNIGFRLLSV